MSWFVEFPAPDKRLSMNDRVHWRVRALRTKAWREAAQIAAYGQLGVTRATRRLPPCLVRVTFPVADNRARDADNPAPTCKAIVDGLVDAGVWADDTTDQVGTLPSRFVKTKGGNGPVIVELIRLESTGYAQINPHANTGCTPTDPQTTGETIEICPTPQAP